MHFREMLPRFIVHLMSVEMAEEPGGHAACDTECGFYP